MAPRKKKMSEQALAIIEKAQELNVLLEKLPKTKENSVAIYNVNQTIQYLIK